MIAQRLSTTMMQRPLRVALLGSRGIPACYGGYETLFEELAPRLVERGFEVTVYCRSHFTPRTLREHKGARLVVLPTIATKHLDTPLHTLLASLATIGRRFDAALVVNAANAAFVPLIRAGGTPVALHVDGIERRRAKWGWLGRAVYAASERLACWWPSALVSDAAVIRDHYRERYGAESTLITYGVAVETPQGTPTLERLGLAPRGYVLYVSRFEPENNPHRVAEAWRQVPGDLPLVMVGAAPYADSFIRSFTSGADPRVLFPGAIYGDGYRELQAHALAYIHATEVGGTHPALVEAMGLGGCPIVHDVPENREVAGDCALWMDAHQPATIAAAVRRVLDEPKLADRLRAAAAARAAERFSWDAVADAYARLFEGLAGRLPAAARNAKVT